MVSVPNAASYVCSKYMHMMSMENIFSQKYLEILSQGIEEIWMDQSFTDVLIHVGAKTFKCHRLILSALSAYFSAMFRSGMRESLAGAVHLHDIDAETFETILRFLYTGRNIVTKENVERLLQACVILQIKCLQEQCECFLKKQLGPENCLGIWSLATSLNCNFLAKTSWMYILAFFPTVVKVDEFGQLSYDEVISIINNNDLNISSEEEVCEAVLKWVSFEPDVRKSQLCNLLSNVRFPLMCSNYVKDLIQKDLILDSDESLQMLTDIYAYLTEPDPCSPAHQRLAEMSRQFKHRQEEMLCIIGTRSRHPNPQATELKCYSFRRDADYTLAGLPQEPGACFAVCKYRDDIYVSGGYHGQNLFLQFVSGENRWQQCGSMVESRWGHSMVPMDNGIYVIGGSTKISQTLSSIEVYNHQKNTCSIVGGLQIPVSFMPTAAVGNRIYIFGGKLQDRTLSTKIQCFDTKKRACFVLDDMPLVSSTASRVAVLEDTVYIFYRHGDIMEYKEGSTAKVISNMPHFDHFGVIPYEGQIMIVGSQSYHFTTVLFNPVTKEMTPWKHTVKAALCNFHCLPVVLSRQYMDRSSDT